MSTEKVAQLTFQTTEFNSACIVCLCGSERVCAWSERVCACVGVCLCMCLARGPCYYVLLLFNGTAVWASSRLQTRYRLPGNCPLIGQLSTSSDQSCRPQSRKCRGGRKTQQRERENRKACEKVCREKTREELERHQLVFPTESDKTEKAEWQLHTNHT